jgi:hypothetical protein
LQTPRQRAPRTARPKVPSTSEDTPTTNSLLEESERLLKLELGGGIPDRKYRRKARTPAEERLEAAIELTRAAFDAEEPVGYSGFKIRGATVVSATAPRAITSIHPDGRTVSVSAIDGSGADVLLTFEHGASVVLPAIRKFRAALTFNDGKLSDVTFREGWVQSSADDPLTSLRAVIASSARFGVFRLEGATAEDLARQMQVAKGIDPSLALYAAYAFDDLRDTGRIVQMDHVLDYKLGVRLFDVAMLSCALDGTTMRPDDGVSPRFPLLSQGWATLRARRISLPRAYDGLDSHLLPSLWTLFSAKGAAIVSEAFESEDA